jgi:hypothetical protein
MSHLETGHARHSRVGQPVTMSGLGLGTMIMTSDGALPVEYLSPGDRIVTHDKGLVRLEKIASREVAARDVVRVSQSFITPEVAVADILIAAGQKVLVSDWRARAMFGASRALVPATKLLDGRYMARLSGARPIRLFRLAFGTEQHILPLADGQLLVTSARLPEKVE